MCSADAEKVEHGCLRFEDCAATDGADFDARHGYGDLEVAVEAGKSVSMIFKSLARLV